MADFVAVLKKTIDGLGDNSPQTREKVYDKARATISAKLAALSPPPASIVIERQKKLLEDAIQSVEKEFAPSADPAPPLRDELEEIFASLDPYRPKKAVAADGVSPPHSGAILAEPASTPSDPVMDFPPVARNYPAPDAPSITPRSDRTDSGRTALSVGGARKKGGTAATALALALLVLAGAAGYAVWMNRVEFGSMLGLSPGDEPGQEQAASPTTPVVSDEDQGTDAGEDDAVDNAPLATAEPDEGTAPPAEAAPDAAAVEPPPVTPAPIPAGPLKFTQRLTADGREVDVGPAGGAPSVGEGTSVATAVLSDQPPAQARPQTEPPADGETAGSGSEETPTTGTQTTTQTPATASPAEAATADPGSSAIAVGQRAIFYEERTSSVQGSAETGSIVWSLVEESPGGDLPPEPTIRAEATVPAKDLQLRLTIRRNRDQTLPASHIVEIIFLTPDNFEGGGIENVLRMTMKTSEEAPGNPLLGIPAKIADGFFLIALTDGKAEIEQNIGLMARDQWIDVPMVYRSGRRALITLEKGIPGGKVFDAAIKAWQSASSG